MVARDVDGGRRGGILRHGRTSRARTGRVAEEYAKGVGGQLGDGLAAIADETGPGRRTVVEQQGPSVRCQTRRAPLGRRR